MKRSSSSDPPLVSKKVKSNANSKPKVSNQSTVKDIKHKFAKKSSPGKKNGTVSFTDKRDKSKGHNMKKKLNTESTLISKKEVTRTSDKSKQSKKYIRPINSKFCRMFHAKKKTGLVMKGGKKALNEIPSNLIGKDGKPEWNKLKDEKKKLKETRKVQRTGEDQYQLSVKAKSIWEKLRRKNHTPEKKETLVNDLFLLLKGQIPNVVHSHDMARVVQWMLKLGSPSIRTAICEELCANTVSYLQSKYASFCVKRALRYGSKADRNHLIQSCRGHFLKLLNYTFAWPVLELMYSKFASAEQRVQLHREIYGEMYALLPPDVSNIQNIPDNMRAAILGSTKINLTKLLDKKQLLKSTLLQSVLNDFLTSCSEQDRNEILELIHGDILDLLETKEGCKVALLTIWHGTNKMKKVIVKSLKGKVKEIAMSENGHLLLLALFDSIDDTVLVKKALIPEMLAETDDLAKHELGRKVLLYLVAHRDPAYFHPQQMKILSKRDAVSSRKKDAKQREQEMFEAVSGPLLTKIAENPAMWFGDSSIAMVSLAIMKSGKGESLQTAFEKMVDYILDPSSMVEINNRQFHIIEHSAMRLIFKKLIQLDQSDPGRTKETFSMVLATKLTEESLNHVIQFNRGCFLLVLLFESKNKKVSKILKTKITEPMKAFLQQQETTGSKILLKKLSEHK